MQLKPLSLYGCKSLWLNLCHLQVGEKYFVGTTTVILKRSTKLLKMAHNAKKINQKTKPFYFSGDLNYLKIYFSVGNQFFYRK